MKTQEMVYYFLKIMVHLKTQTEFKACLFLRKDTLKKLLVLEHSPETSMISTKLFND